MSGAMVPLKRFCIGAPEYGLNIPASEYRGEGIRFLRTSDIGASGTLDDSSAVFVSSDLEIEPRHRLRPGDLLFSRSGTLGRCLRYRPETGDATYAGYLVRLRPSDDADARYLEYCSQAAFFQGAIIADAVTSTISNFNAEKYASIRCPMRPVREQRAIADYLDVETARIDALIAKKQQLLQLAVEYRSSQTLAAVSGATTYVGHFVPSSLAWVSAIPQYWKAGLLRLVARQGTGHTPSRERPDWWVPDECVVPWVTTGEVQQVRSDRVNIVSETRERLSPLGIANSSAEIHPAGTVFLCRTASAGYSGIMGVPMATSQDFATWTCGSNLLPQYLLYCLRSMRQDLLGRLATGSTHKTIYMPDIQGLKIPMPPIEAQTEICRKLEAALNRSFKVSDRLTHQIDLLAEHRQALITSAVTGQHRVPGVA